MIRHSALACLLLATSSFAEPLPTAPDFGPAAKALKKASPEEKKQLLDNIKKGVESIREPIWEAQRLVLSDSNEEVRIAAAELLEAAGYGIAGIAQLRELVEALKDKSPQVRQRMVRVVGLLAAHHSLLDHLRPQASAAALELCRLLKEDESAAVRQRATEALRGLQKHANITVPALIHALNDPDNKNQGDRSSPPSVVQSAIFSLECYGNEAKQAAPHLFKLFATADPAMKHWILRALGKIKDDPNQLLKLIAEILNDPKQANLHRSALTALAFIGEDGSEAVPLLIRIVESHSKNDSEDQRRVQIDAAYTLSKMGEKAIAALPMFLKILETKFSEDREHLSSLRNAAFVVIAKLGPAAKDAIPSLMHALNDDAPFGAEQDRFVNAVVALGPEAVKALGKKLEKKDDYFSQRHIIEMLKSMGAAAKPAIPSLQVIADSTNPDMSRPALTAIKYINTAK